MHIHFFSCFASIRQRIAYTLLLVSVEWLKLFLVVVCPLCSTHLCKQKIKMRFAHGFIQYVRVVVVLVARSGYLLYFYTLRYCSHIWIFKAVWQGAYVQSSAYYDRMSHLNCLRTQVNLRGVVKLFISMAVLWRLICRAHKRGNDRTGYLHAMGAGASIVA